ncbi:MAG TPA: cupredoxin domain-containing protein [Candidatus Binatia bacterium]|nr:cupredoxin domain-containing protein [Candidatus Binatia bacterium]
MKRILLAALVLAVLVVVAGGCQRSSQAAPQTVKVSVTDAGFVPSELKVKNGVPVVLLVTRTTDETCAKEIVIPDQHIRRALPLNQPVAITFTPEKRGAIKYACGMEMVSGTLRVQ